MLNEDILDIEIDLMETRMLFKKRRINRRLFKISKINHQFE